MNYLNLETRTLHAPEYIGATPTTRATWLNVALWCAQQENGGIVRDCAAWPDRQWQQTCGVTSEEIHAAAPLVTFDGSDCFVFFYPAEQEAIVREKRKTAQANGKLGGRPCKQETNTGTNVGSNVGTNIRKRKGKEGKGKESILAPNGAKVGRERNPLLDALVATDGSNPAEVTGSAWGAAAKALAEIKAVCAEVTPAEIARRAENYRTQFADAAISPNALSKHWARCQHAGATVTARPEATVRRIVL